MKKITLLILFLSGNLNSQNYLDQLLTQTRNKLKSITQEQFEALYWGTAAALTAQNTC